MAKLKTTPTTENQTNKAAVCFSVCIITLHTVQAERQPDNNLKHQSVWCIRLSIKLQIQFWVIQYTKIK